MIELTSGQHLHRLPFSSQPVCVERLGRDLTALEVCAEDLDVHGGVLDAVGVREALQLGHPALQRHLAALEARRNVLAGACPLRAPARGLASDAGPSSPDPLAIGLCALGRMQMMELHPTSSTSTR